jgi:hypothetical protein
MKQKRVAIQADTSANAWMGSQRKTESKIFMRKNYYYGFTRKFDGLGIMLSIDPPYTTIRRAWSFNLKLGWFIFWYVKERKRSR